MHRFFVPAEAVRSAAGAACPERVAAGSGRIRFSPDQVRQMQRVLRLRPGDTVVAVLAGPPGAPGREFVTRLEGENGGTAELSGGGPIIEERQGLPPAPVAVDVYQALPKGDRFEAVLQKGTELGVDRIVPVISRRTVARPDAGRSEGKVARWRAVVREAAEQCGRSDEPSLTTPLDWARACAEAGRADLAVVPWEREEAAALDEVLGEFRRSRAEDQRPDAPGPRPLGPGPSRLRPRVAILVGPEGGLTEDEVAAAAGLGIKPVSLGPRILRTDTAAVAALCMVLYELGDLGRRPEGRPPGGLPGFDGDGEGAGLRRE